MVDWMNRNITSEHPDVVPMLTDGKVLPFDDDFADIVFMITVHHELDDKAGILREARRILKPGGSIFIVDFSADGGGFGPPVEIRSRPEDVVQQLLDAGFKNAGIDRGIENFFLVTAAA